MTASSRAAAAPRTQSSVLHGFHPGWSAAVMGAGIVAIAGYLNPGDESELLRAAHVFGVAVGILTWLLAVAVAYLLRLLGYREAALSDLRHPVVGALFATLPAAVIVLATTTAATVGGVTSLRERGLHNGRHSRGDRRPARVRSRRPLHLHPLRRRRPSGRCSQRRMDHVVGSIAGP